MILESVDADPAAAEGTVTALVPLGPQVDSEASPYRLDDAFFRRGNQCLVKALASFSAK